MSPCLLHTKSANTLIMSKCRSTVFESTRCNTQDCWRSVDALLTLCWRSANALLTLCWHSVDALLTLCWCSLSGEATSSLTILPIKATNTSIMDTSRSTALGWHKMQHTKSLTLCWRSFSDWGWDHVAFSFAHKGCQYIHYGWMPEHSLWIIQDATPKIVDALLTLCWYSVDALLMLCWCSVHAHYQVKQHGH